MGFIKSIIKRIDWKLNVSFDKKTGFYRYKRKKGFIYIRYPRHYLDNISNEWLCNNLYYYYYMPTNNNTVVDLGTGYGEEALYLHDQSPNLNFYGVEIQPVIFECLANTLNSIGNNFKAISTAINNGDAIKLCSQLSYFTVCDNQENGYIDIPTVTCKDFLQKNNINNVDLLKMNIEGGEKQFLESIDDFSSIRHMIISCHDFRANSGHGEFYRTKDKVLSILRDNKFELKFFNHDEDWAKDWVFAKNTIT